MGYIANEMCKVYLGEAGGAGSIIYIIDSPEHPFDVANLTKGRSATIATIPVNNWNDALTPWRAAGLYREEPDFGGEATLTLAQLTNETIPLIEKTAGLLPANRAICGYSLGGLFSLYALTRTTLFDACACLSGSVWYEGWVEHLREMSLDLTGKFAYLSLGTKERKAARPILKTVQDRMEQCAEILRASGCLVEYRTGPGNHMQHIAERFDAGITELDSFLTR